MRHASDVTAFSEFVEARSSSLFRTAYLMVGDHQLAQDSVVHAGDVPFGVARGVEAVPAR